ncbi:MAG: hypothetical protein A3B37_03515 [Candidatus Sungbacteria bacterium RIFCSPLOWO2_01_FULL_59_16]|uniref:Uncharacterized protein n=1 Tax=Candidatus Sungbacteria bacterium RIFCSPLOWO2_01_FULL_59_16 TaxID=1802280 RepID=A0A1G2LC89_9BACT|nr:MAG: hypothetical protein A3B37_03515 [Candidatus Sungbacteria bacterium RIFCSPLOWO2_01_FULL_59_16]
MAPLSDIQAMRHILSPFIRILADRELRFHFATSAKSRPDFNRLAYSAAKHPSTKLENVFTAA